MKQILCILFSLSLLLPFSSCYSQKVMKTVGDAQKLVENKEKFIGKPLSQLLKQIEPKIKFVYGNPDNNWAGATGGTFLAFHFVGREEGLKRLSKKDNPTAIIVNFELDLNNKHKPLQNDGRIELWTDAETKEYGDMIILNIRVTGKD